MAPAGELLAALGKAAGARMVSMTFDAGFFLAWEAIVCSFEEPRYIIRRRPRSYIHSSVPAAHSGSIL